VTGRFSKQELEDAFDNYQQASAKAAASRDWSGWAELFTEDATYLEHVYGTFHGREEIRRWITATMGSFPGSRMTEFPVEWHIIDDDRGWVVCHVWNRMEDPGDGSIHQAYNLTVLHYAGDGQWSYEEDVYNPAHFMSMLDGWHRQAEQLGRLPDDARAWFAAMVTGRA
jgi:uncharacterized protein (TIGR02246 family)